MDGAGATMTHQSARQPARASRCAKALGGALFWLGACSNDLPEAMTIEQQPEDALREGGIVVERAASERSRREAHLHNRDVVQQRRANCPEMSYARIGPALRAGPTFASIAARVPATDMIQMTAHPVTLPGVAHYEVLTDVAGTFVWSARGCFVGAQRVYCGDRRSDGALRAFIVDHDLDDDPLQLTGPQWLHLIAVLRGASKILALPGRDVANCRDGVPEAVRRATFSRVEVAEDRVEVRVATEDRGVQPRFGPYEGGWHAHTVVVGGGVVESTTEALWPERGLFGYTR